MASSDNENQNQSPNLNQNFESGDNNPAALYLEKFLNDNSPPGFEHVGHSNSNTWDSSYIHLLPTLKKSDMVTSLKEFTNFLNIMGAPIELRHNLLLGQVHKMDNEVFREYLRKETHSYKELNIFLQGRFHSTSPIFNLKLDPKFLNIDPQTHYSRVQSIVEHTDKSDLIRFLLIKSCPRSVQEGMKFHQFLNHDNFIRQYLIEMTKFNTSPNYNSQYREKHFDNYQDNRQERNFQEGRNYLNTHGRRNPQNHFPVAPPRGMQSSQNTNN